MRMLIVLSILALATTGCGGEEKKKSSRLDSGTHQIEGACSESDEEAEIWKIAHVSGTITAEVTWDESDGDDIDLALVDYDSEQILEIDGNGPPGDSPAEISGVISDELDVAIAVVCFTGTGVSFDGTIIVP